MNMFGELLAAAGYKDSDVVHVGQARPVRCACGYLARDQRDLDDHMTDTAFSSDAEGTHHATHN